MLSFISTHRFIAKSSSWNMFGKHPISMESLQRIHILCDVIEPSVYYLIVISLRSRSSVESFQLANFKLLCEVYVFGNAVLREKKQFRQLKSAMLAVGLLQSSGQQRTSTV